MKFQIFIIEAVLFLGSITLPIYAAESWPPTVSSLDFLPGCESLLLNRPALFEGGNIVLDQGETWLVLGVGTASVVLEGGQKQSEDATWKVANAKAIAALTEAIWGARRSATESFETRIVESEGGTKTLEHIRFLTEKERNGVLAGSWEAGRWKLRDGQKVGVLRIVASPGHPITKKMGGISVVSDTLSPEWREVILSRQALRYGGVATAQHQGKTWLLVTGSTRVKKDVTSIPLDRLTIAEINAKAEWGRFVTGVRLRDKTQTALEVDRIQIENEPAWEDIRETLTRCTETKLRSFERGLVPTGMWLADAGDTWRLVAVFRISFSGDKPVTASGSLRLPTIPR